MNMFKKRGKRGGLQWDELATIGIIAVVVILIVGGVSGAFSKVFSWFNSGPDNLEIVFQKCIQYSESGLPSYCYEFTEVGNGKWVNCPYISLLYPRSGVNSTMVCYGENVIPGEINNDDIANNYCVQLQQEENYNGKDKVNNVPCKKLSELAQGTTGFGFA